ncbi:MAG: FtsW/RodA/SpoVE family cell cycle protein, partial [Clostridia bacterium]|nr:FtsW/RodA/SpoVE family cell cycle protein [Clostridia bacterium]
MSTQNESIADRLKDFVSDKKVTGKMMSDAEELRSKKRRLKRFNFFMLGNGLDLTFLLLLGSLLIIGLVMMFSASFPSAYYSKNNSNYFINRQLFFAVGGFIGAIAVSCVDYHHFHKVAKGFLVAAWILMVVVLITNHGSDEPKRWFNIGPFGFQVSELTKFALILYMAHWGSIHYDKMRTFKYGVLPGLVLIIITRELL